jgi:hypothetical protein
MTGAAALRELLDRLRQAADGILDYLATEQIRGVHVSADGGDVVLELHGAEIEPEDDTCACVHSQWTGCYGDAYARLTPAETVALAIRLIETAARALETETRP